MERHRNWQLVDEHLSAIGLLGLVGVLSIVLWRSLGAGALAPFIHLSGAYVPVAGFAFVQELGRPGANWSPLRMLGADFRWLTIGLAACIVSFVVFFTIAVRLHGSFLTMAHSPLSAAAVINSIYVPLSEGMALELRRPLMPRTGLAVIGSIALAVALALGVAGTLRVGVSQR